MDWTLIRNHGRLAGGIILATSVIHIVMYIGAGYFANDWWKDAILHQYTELPAEPTLNDQAATHPPWAVRLDEMYRDVRQHSGIQLKSYLSMQYTYYAFTMTWAILSALAALLGVFVVKDGWTAANNYLLNAALTITLLMTFWQAMPKMLSMSSNIAAAKKSYLSSVQLGNELRSFARQSHTLTSGRPAEDVEADFINKADKRFSEIRNLNFDIDAAQAPDYRKAIQDQMKTQ